MTARRPRMETLDPTGMRASNAGIVLEDIFARGPVSRVDISRYSGLSRTTVSAIVADLIDSGVAIEVGSGVSRGGRKPVLVDLDENSRVLAGADMGADRIDVVLLTLRGRIVGSAGARHPVRADPHGAFDVLARLVDEAATVAGVRLDDVVGMGVGIASPISGVDQHEVTSVVFRAWDGIDVVAELTRRLGMEVMIDNDANVGALAEHWWGAGRGFDDFAYLELGVGVGMGVVMGGRVYRGSIGFAGEIGHVRVADSGDCSCGRVGCLETQVGIDRLADAFARRVGRAADFEGLVEATAAGDADAAAVIEETGRILGGAISYVVGLLNPSVVILAGPLTAAGEALRRPLVETLRGATFGPSTDVPVVISDLQHMSAAIGGATRVLERGLHEGSLIAAAGPAVSAAGAL